MIDPKFESGSRLRAYLVGIERHPTTHAEAAEHLEELEQLVNTMNAEIVGSELIKVSKPTPQYLTGLGKLEMIHEAAKASDAALIVIDDDLSPAQQRNWEEKTDLAVIDRREVILDIFAQRARTREAKLQIELAKLEYSLPRLKRAWTHLERQRGGAGFVGGAGEAQIEVDRRLVRDAIAKHKRDLKAVRQQRATQRKSRRSKPVPTAALVGYTNSGKSSILNMMTGAGVLAEDKLFATLDPTTRRIKLPNEQVLLLSDTVGFIRKLPTMLVEAFKATLEEAEHADFLLHVVDASHPSAMDQVEATEGVLKELNLGDKQTLYVLNKMDKVSDPLAIAALRNRCTPNVTISAVTGEGVHRLIEEIVKLASAGSQHLELRLPHNRQDLVSLLHREAHILSEKYDEDGILISVDVPERLVAAVSNFRIGAESHA